MEKDLLDNEIKEIEKIYYNKKRTTVYVDKNLYKRVRIYCAMNGTSFSKLVNDYLESIKIDKNGI